MSAGRAATASSPRTSAHARSAPSKAVRERVWLHTCGMRFECKCPVPWCENTMNVFNYHVAHDVAVCRGGSNELDNLVALCSRCNHSTRRLDLTLTGRRIEF